MKQKLFKNKWDGWCRGPGCNYVQYEMSCKKLISFKNFETYLKGIVALSAKKCEGWSGMCCLYSCGKCLRRVVVSALHWIRMWITDRCSPHLLHRGLGDPVSRWECVACVWPIRNLASVASLNLLCVSVVYRPKCGFIRCSLLSVSSLHRVCQGGWRMISIVSLVSVYSRRTSYTHICILL